MSAADAASEQGVSTPARVIGALALVAAFVLVGFLLFGGNGSGHRYTFLFETGGQLVPGNQVLIAGQPVGKIDDLDLTDDAQARVDVTLDDPISEGTTAVVRSTSLSGVANRYISLQPGPDNMPELDEGTTVSGEDTTAPVDIDQFFDIFRPKERRALQKFIQGSATIYTDKAKLANKAYKFFNPALNSGERLFAELSRDSIALERLLVSGATTFGAIADRRDDLASFVTDANTALGAVANQNSALERSLAALPGTLRQANTTFVNLRAALDDLDPLVEASYPGTEDLAPFLRRLKNTAEDSKPVFSDLAKVVNRDGPANDLADTLKDLPKVESAGETAWPAAIDAMDDSQPNLAFIRPYTPDIFGLLAKLGQTTAYYDANGHYARVSPAASNIYQYDAGSNSLQTIFTERDKQFDDLTFSNGLRRCPGGGTQQAADLSNPFLDDGNLTAADCDPSALPPP